MIKKRCGYSIGEYMERKKKRQEKKEMNGILRLPKENE